MLLPAREAAKEEGGRRPGEGPADAAVGVAREAAERGGDESARRPETGQDQDRDTDEDEDEDEDEDDGDAVAGTQQDAVDVSNRDAGAEGNGAPEGNGAVDVVLESPPVEAARDDRAAAAGRGDTLGGSARPGEASARDEQDEDDEVFGDRVVDSLAILDHRDADDGRHGRAFGTKEVLRCSSEGPTECTLNRAAATPGRCGVEHAGAPEDRGPAADRDGAAPDADEEVVPATHDGMGALRHAGGKVPFFLPEPSPFTGAEDTAPDGGRPPAVPGGPDRARDHRESSRQGTIEGGEPPRREEPGLVPPPQSHAVAGFEGTEWTLRTVYRRFNFRGEAFALGDAVELTLRGGDGPPVLGRLESCWQESPVAPGGLRVEVRLFARPSTTPFPLGGEDSELYASDAVKTVALESIGGMRKVTVVHSRAELEGASTATRAYLCRFHFLSRPSPALVEWKWMAPYDDDDDDDGMTTAPGRM